MKIFYLFLLFISSFVVAQSKSCETPKIESLDLNSITKCSIERTKGETNKRKVALKVHTKKRKSVYFRKKRTPKKTSQQSLNTAGLKNNTDLTVEFKSEKIETLQLNEVLFSVVDEIPLFPSCQNDEITDKAKCFNEKMSHHFAENFIAEQASDEGIEGRVFIQFTIDVKGDVKNLLVKGPKKAHSLEEEVTRVIKKLPIFSAGKHKNFPVNVKYSLPINFTTD